MAIEERRDRVADILVEGLLRLLVEEGRLDEEDVLPAEEQTVRLGRVSFDEEDDSE